MKSNTIQNRYDLWDNERLIMETTAHLKLSSEKISGRLILTSKRLLFRNDDSKAEKVIPLHQIDSLKAFRTWSFFYKGIMIRLLNDSVIMLVEYPKDWLKLITLQMKKVEVLKATSESVR